MTASHMAGPWEPELLPEGESARGRGGALFLSTFVKRDGEGACSPRLQIIVHFPNLFTKFPTSFYFEC